MTITQPATIADAVRALRKLLPTEQLDVIKRSTREDLVRFHFNLGAYIRNLWVYRGGTPLTTRIRELGGHVGHGDDLSNLIIEALWHELNGRNFDLRDSSHFRRILRDGTSHSQVADLLLQSS